MDERVKNSIGISALSIITTTILVLRVICAGKKNAEDHNENDNKKEDCISCFLGCMIVIYPIAGTYVKYFDLKKSNIIFRVN